MSAPKRAKLLVLAQYFKERTDEKHAVTLAELQDVLAAQDIYADRKTLYEDFEILRDFGIQISRDDRTRPPKYYLQERDFSLSELKLLADSVQSSKFITDRKTGELIRKIQRLANVHDAQLLGRQLHVNNRVKSMNQSIFVNVDEISTAISNDSMIRFRYFHYDIRKQRAYRKNGGFYEVSPFALILDDENYYLRAWDETAGIFKNFRVDKMVDISPMKKARQGKEAFAREDISSYNTRVFSMYSGETQRVKLRMKNNLLDAIIDRFGTDISIVPDGEDYFNTTVEVIDSLKFYAWVFSFGVEAEVLWPESMRADMAKYLRDTAALYSDI